MKPTAAEEAEMTVPQPHMKTIIKRAVLAVIALVVLIAAAVYLTLGWYTKMTGVTTTEFTVARWDFNANYQIDSFDVNVYEYSHVDGHNIAAPGTSGTLELRLGADDSDTDVHYLVQIDKGTMSEEFQKRIYFYYDNNGVREEFVYGSSSITGEIAAHGYTVVTLYWEWVYDYDEYLQKQGDNPFRDAVLEIGSAYSEDYEKMGIDYYAIKDVISITDTIPDGKDNLIKNLYNTYYNIDTPAFNEVETTIISKICEAWVNANEAVFISSSGINPLEAPMSQTAAGDGSVYDYACRMASDIGTVSEQFDLFITQNVLGFPDDLLDDLSIYMFGGTVEGHLTHTTNIHDLLVRACNLFAETETEDSPAGNNLIFRGLFNLARLDKTTVLNTFSHLDEYSQKVHSFSGKYYSVISSGTDNATFSSVAEAAKEAWSSGNYDGDLEDFADTLTEDSFATPADYLEAYRSYYYSYTTVLAMSDEFASERDEFDAYDTKIGGDPQYYRQFMNAKVYIIGEQVVPTEVTH